jgi:hypothetical protein
MDSSKLSQEIKVHPNVILLKLEIFFLTDGVVLFSKSFPNAVHLLP